MLFWTVLYILRLKGCASHRSKLYTRVLYSRCCCREIILPLQQLLCYTHLLCDFFCTTCVSRLLYVQLLLNNFYVFVETNLNAMPQVLAIPMQRRVFYFTMDSHLSSNAITRKRILQRSLCLDIGAIVDAFIRRLIKNYTIFKKTLHEQIYWLRMCWLFLSIYMNTHLSK